MLIKNSHTAIIHLPDVKRDAEYDGRSSYSLQPKSETHSGINEVPDAYMARLQDHPFVRDLFRARKGVNGGKPLLSEWKAPAPDAQPAKEEGHGAPAKTEAKTETPKTDAPTTSPQTQPQTAPTQVQPVATPTAPAPLPPLPTAPVKS